MGLLVASVSNTSWLWQMRAAHSQLSAFEMEVGRLTTSQALSQEQWTSKTNSLQQDLDQATTQKVGGSGTW